MKTTIILLLAFAAFAVADLRMASQPTNGYKVADRSRQAPFVPDFALYMEPSDFGYEGLKKQRDNGAYDNFLRSNIDNEQDKRDFQKEDGKDHLPFRSFETAATTAHASIKNKIPTTAPGPAIVTAPGVQYIVPLRWNNPHSSELEVNVWIMNTKNAYVVPIKKPTCSGEGRQDLVFEFTIPSDFNNLGVRVPGFTGCKKVGDCILQIYAHSVETRQYAMGTPLIVNGTVNAATATNENQIEQTKNDVGTNVNSLVNKICVSSADRNADVSSAVPRFPRLISDVYNHAYQNSDYSPYSGQQPDQISQNLQAACVLKMVTGDRGELGKALLKKNNTVAAFQKKIEKKAEELIRVYESITNQIIEEIGDLPLSMNNDTSMAQGQKTATCFRCAEVGSVTTERQTTNTYVPSFRIPTNYIDQARQYVAPVYSKLIQNDGLLQIYTSVLSDMNALFIRASAMGLDYQGPAIKSTLTTLTDVTNFKKIDAAGKADNGIYAATEAAKIKKIQKVSANGVVAPLDKLLSSLTAAFITEEEDDMNALNVDTSCDNDKTWTVALSANCTMKGANVAKGTQLFLMEGQSAASTEAALSISAASVSGPWALATTVAVALAAALLN